jgi:hypothetical protein
MNSDVKDFWDYFSIAVQACTPLVGILGLAGVVYSLKRNREQQRIQAGPYVRIDIGPTAGIEDQRELDVYYADVSQVVDLSHGAENTLEISAWFRNYQSEALGFALGVTASFVVEVTEPSVARTRSDQVDVEIPYLEYGKCVRIALARLPIQLELTVILLSVSFYDLYDQLHEHAYGKNSSSAMHGRLVWQKTDDFEESTPEGRSRGRGVDYNIGGIGGAV